MSGLGPDHSLADSILSLEEYLSLHHPSELGEMPFPGHFESSLFQMENIPPATSMPLFDISLPAAALGDQGPLLTTLPPLLPSQAVAPQDSLPPQPVSRSDAPTAIDETPQSPEQPLQRKSSKPHRKLPPTQPPSIEEITDQFDDKIAALKEEINKVKNTIASLQSTLEKSNRKRDKELSRVSSSDKDSKRKVTNRYSAQKARLKSKIDDHKKEKEILALKIEVLKLKKRNSVLENENDELKEMVHPSSAAPLLFSSAGKIPAEMNKRSNPSSASFTDKRKARATTY